MKTLAHLFLVTGLIGLAACSKPDADDVSPDNNQPQAGFVKGKVFDTQGRPLAGATINANSAIYFNDSNVGLSDAKGSYRISLPNGPAAGAFYVRGSVKMKLDGKTYQLPLFTEEDGTFTPDEGAVKNLRLKLSGERTGNFGDDGLYGGTVSITNHTQGPALRTGDIEFTLDPIVLIDGSPGETLVFHTDGFEVRGAPIGRYRVSARHIPTNQPLSIRILDSNREFQESITTIFQSNYYIDSIYEMHLEVTN